VELSIASLLLARAQLGLLAVCVFCLSGLAWAWMGGGAGCHRCLGVLSVGQMWRTAILLALGSGAVFAMDGSRDREVNRVA
jgi:sorbitol-specific phosphotransferase system component IIBC